MVFIFRSLLLPHSTFDSSCTWPYPFAVAQIVKPLWEPFVVLFPELSPLLRNLHKNCDYYFREGERLEQERLAVATVPAPSSRANSGKNMTGGGGGRREEGLADTEIRRQGLKGPLATTAMTG